MKYFILDIDKEYTPPNIKNWYGKLDKNTLSGKNHHQLPRFMTFTSNDTMQTVYTDFMMHPYFMVSKNMKEVIELYEPLVRSARIIIFSSISGNGQAYYIPFLEEVNCLGEGSLLNLDKSIIHHAQINGMYIKDKAIIRVADINRTCILVREDFVESLLYRQLVGVGLWETEVVY